MPQYSITDLPDQQLVPNEPLSDNPTASEIADMVLSGELDMSKWRYVNDSRLADAFLDVVGILVSFGDDIALEPLENRSELLSQIQSDIHSKIKLWAIRETSCREGGLGTLL